MAIIIVGDAAEILPQAREYAGDIEVFDTNAEARSLSIYEQASAEPADFSGSWKLMVDFQGQQVPVSLTLEQNGEGVSGRLETILGNGNISEGSVRGNRVAATAKTEIQGQEVDFVINGSISDGVMSGSISAAIIPDSLTFTGSKI
jgi:hypothetical protein